MRRTLLGGLAAILSAGKGKAAAPEKAAFPPVPTWKPSFPQPLNQIADRVSYYSNGKRDFALLQNGTCVILERGLSDEEASAFSITVLSSILHAHPDMHPNRMDDGNIMVRYNHPAVNVVLHDIAKAHWPEIEARHLDGLTTSEVLMTPLGANKFDDVGKRALLGRAYMFMDAQAPKILRIERHG